MRTFPRTFSPWLLVLALLVFSAPVAAAPALPGRTSSSEITAAEYAPDSEECAFLGIINAHRASIGKGALVLSASIGAAADHHSIEMADNNYFSHTMLGGVSPSTNLANHGYSVSQTSWGEIIAAGMQTAQAAFNKWMASTTGHREIMENGVYTALGVGRAYNASSTYDWYWTAILTSRPQDTISCNGSPVSTPTPLPTAIPTATPATHVKLTIVTGGRTSNSTTSRNAFDNNTSTSWSTIATSPPSYGYVWFDLGAVKNIGQIKFKFSKTCCADSYRIQVSNDRSTWTTISTRTNPTATNTWIYKNWTGQARYVRFYFKNPNGDANIGYLSEVVIYSP